LSLLIFKPCLEALRAKAELAKKMLQVLPAVRVDSSAKMTRRQDFFVATMAKAAWSALQG
jgi:hypothetical protein